MKKIVVHKAGSYDRLVLEEHPDPVPGPDEVLVDVTAASVNFADCSVRMGLYSSAKEYVGWPITPGFDIAGTCDGRRVFGVTLFGGYASRVAVPPHQLFDTPEDWSDDQAAAFPTVNVTAWYALKHLSRPVAGETVLIHSASGGVGGAAISIAKQMGARVVAVVGRAHKEQLARDRGADEVIVREREDLWSTVGELDVILDASGGPGLRDGYGHLAPGGRLVVYGAAAMLKRGRGRPDWPKLAWSFLRTPRFGPLDLVTRNKSVLGFNLSYLFPKADLLRAAMTDLLDLHRAGHLPHPPVQAFPLEEVAAAHRAIETGDTVGKLVLRTGPFDVGFEPLGAARDRPPGS